MYHAQGRYCAESPKGRRIETYRSKNTFGTSLSSQHQSCHALSQPDHIWLGQDVIQIKWNDTRRKGRKQTGAKSFWNTLFPIRVLLLWRVCRGWWKSWDPNCTPSGSPGCVSLYVISNFVFILYETNLLLEKPMMPFHSFIFGRPIMVQTAIFLPRPNINKTGSPVSSSLMVYDNRQLLRAC